MRGSAKFSGSIIELVTVASICALLLYLEAQFGALSAAAALLAHASSSAMSYLVAVGVALWIGMALYSLRRRRELSREIEAHRALQSEFEAAIVTDKMTGLPNRHGLEAYLEAMAGACAGDKELMLIGALFSNLKMIANVQGFDIANAIAMEATERLVGRVHVPELVASVNGEQFYILLEGEGRSVRRAGERLDRLPDRRLSQHRSEKRAELAARRSHRRRQPFGLPAKLEVADRRAK